MSSNLKLPKRQEKVQFYSKKKITIYGPYYPETERDRLYNLKRYLEERNINDINLVRDYPLNFFPFPLPSDEDQRNLERSRYCLKKSDLNILIFTFKGECSGVCKELDHCTYNKIDFLVFFEFKIVNEKKITAGSTLIKGGLKEIRKSYNEFAEGDNAYLCDAVYSRVMDFFF
ncbi:MAG: hypothetical protein ACFFAN_11805 [Promethearchaeota archaeon]